MVNGGHNLEAMFREFWLASDALKALCLPFDWRERIHIYRNYGGWNDYGVGSWWRVFVALHVSVVSQLLSKDSDCQRGLWSDEEGIRLLAKKTSRSTR